MIMDQPPSVDIRPTMYTIGTSLRSSEEFVEMLRAHEIRSLADVRSYPKSKLPHFSAGEFKGLLELQGISYHYLGRELGGLRKGGFPAYTATSAFSEGISSLEDIAREGRTVVACSERFPWKCHRRWIARELHFRGWRVVHIIDKDHIWIPE